MPKINRALVSVTDKTGVVDFCKVLAQWGVEILSTGGTAKTLRDAGLQVVDVSKFTNSPEVLDGRLKTLHPKIEGGILGIRSNPQHQKEMQENGILPIDLVAVNLYAFEKTVADPHCTLAHAVENIDIGGPTMLRAAAKNHPDVTVVTDPFDYARIIQEMQKNEGVISAETNFELAVKVFQLTSRYDIAISNYLTRQVEKEAAFPSRLTISLEKMQDVRYGENPHQKAAVYCEVGAGESVLTHAKQLQGKELSFNNYIDLEAAWNGACEFDLPACVIIKHTNPCGVAVGKNVQEAFLKAKECDPISAFGGIIGFNKPVDAATASSIGETFFECLIAPSFDADALKILSAKKNLRLMTLERKAGAREMLDFKKIGGGFLVQQKDEGSVDLKSCPVPTVRKPTEAEYADLAFAWKVAKHVKSNAIVFSKDGQTLGVGAGQMSRVDSVKIAVMKAQKSLVGSVLASDAFFPFRDGLDLAAEQKITAIVQPGGSLRDEEVIKAANEHGLTMVFAGMRHFKH